MKKNKYLIFFAIVKILMIIIIFQAFHKRKTFLLNKIKFINDRIKKYNLLLFIERIKWSYNSLYIQNIKALHKEKGIEIECNEVEIRFDLKRFIKTFEITKSVSIKINDVNAILKQPGSEVFSISRPNAKGEEEKEIHRVGGYVYKAYIKIIDFIFRFSTVNIVVPQFSMNAFGINSNIKNISRNGNIFKSDLYLEMAGSTTEYALEGTFDKKRIATFKLYRKEFTRPQTVIQICFLQSLDLQINLSKENKILIEGVARKIFVDLRSISSTPFGIDAIDLCLDLMLSPNSIELSKESGGEINGVPFALSFIYNFSKENVIRTKFYLEINPGFFSEHQPFFSIPELKKIKTEGRVLIKCSLVFDVANPYYHFFDIKFLENSFSILDISGFDLYYINGNFRHKLYKDENFLREIDIQIGDQFISVSAIPKKIKDILIFSEDPNFYDHRGIDFHFLGVAIVANIASKRFIKGASTITMQLVRNLFLNHGKNIFRKIEETLITYLMENHFKISKERILELYLNIIEFGPNVYGIKEASIFYFKKEVNLLTPAECIVISYIIPRPIHFYDALIAKSPRLEKNLKNYTEQKSKQLLEKGIIDLEEFNKIEPYSYVF
jgi:hypothetical protein